MVHYILADLISFLEIQRLQLAGSSSTVFAANLILYIYFVSFLIFWTESQLNGFDFDFEAEEARELIKNRELNLYLSRDRLSHLPKLSYLGEHSEVTRAEPECCIMTD